MSNVELYVHSSFGRDKQPPEWFKGRRARWQRRETDDIIALVLHQTDVRGQFGPVDFAGLAKRLAGTGEDRRGVPYHYFYSPRHETVIALWHPAWYSYHGDLSNRYSIGVAIDGKYPGDDLDASGWAHAVEVVLHHVGALGYSLRYVEAHRQHEDVRAGDPGRGPWRAAEPVCRRFGLEPRPAHTTGDGLSLPSSWLVGYAADPPDVPAQDPSLEEPCEGFALPTLDLDSLDRTRDRAAVKTLQGLLLARGLGPDGLVGRNGKPDGIVGPKTRKALADFCEGEGLGSGDFVDVQVWSALLMR